MNRLEILAFLLGFIILLSIVILMKEGYTGVVAGRRIGNTGMRYGSATQSVDSEMVRTVDYKVQGAIPDMQLPYNALTPDMLHLPKPTLYGPPNCHPLDPYSGYDETIFKSPTIIPISDFESETTRDYKNYT